MRACHRRLSNWSSSSTALWAGRLFQPRSVKPAKKSASTTSIFHRTREMVWLGDVKNRGWVVLIKDKHIRYLQVGEYWLTQAGKVPGA